jgi:hypothetical protein
LFAVALKIPQSHHVSVDTTIAARQISFDHRPTMGELAMNGIERFASPQIVKAGDPNASNDRVVEGADQYVSAVAQLREEKARLLDKLSSLQQQKAFLQSEKEELTALLQKEKADCSRYQTFTVQVGTSLGLVAQICNQVLEKAEQAQRGRPLDRPTPSRGHR